VIVTLLDSFKSSSLKNRRAAREPSIEENKCSRLLAIALAINVLLCCPSGTTLEAAEKTPLQAIVVTTANWSDIDAAMRLYERKDAMSAWVMTEEVSAVVCRAGLAWGKGLHPDPPAGEPQKREGDGKAPAGIFRLGPAFGYAPDEAVKWIALPYRQMTERSKCVDDPASVYYNRLVEKGKVVQDWNSIEDMRRSDELYRLGVVIGHNDDPVNPGGGSCIFLHIRGKSPGGTAGCTAVSAADMEKMLRRLNPESSPRLIQLPLQEYERLRTSWKLP
jgi:D-alanyl-D-alanine dipeptidase